MLVIVISLFAVYDIISSQTQAQSPSNSFIQEPVVDILVPSLFERTPTGGQNEPLNVTTGQDIELVLQVYPTVNLNLSMEFRYYLLSATEAQNSSSDNSSQLISANFNPTSMRIASGKTANTTVSLQVSQTAPEGQYNAILSALNTDNSSEIWGVIIQINVR